MNITPKTIAFAIHRIFAGRQITQGCSIPLRELMQAWPESLLRRSDLVKGLGWLREAGHLSIEQTAQGPMVRLLDETFGLVRSKDDREALTVLARLREVRRRPQLHVSALIPMHACRRLGEALA